MLVKIPSPDLAKGEIIRHFKYENTKQDLRGILILKKKGHCIVPVNFRRQVTNIANES